MGKRRPLGDAGRTPGVLKVDQIVSGQFDRMERERIPTLDRI